MHFIPIFLSFLSAVSAAAVPDNALSALNRLQTSVIPYEQYIEGNVTALGTNPTAQQKSAAQDAVLKNFQAIGAATDATHRGIASGGLLTSAAIDASGLGLGVSAQTALQLKESLTNYQNGVQTAHQQALSIDDPISSILSAIYYGILDFIGYILEHIDPEL